MTGERRRGHLERAVMDCLWDHPAGLTATEVVELLDERSLALTTVLTVLDRLRGKGMVLRWREGRAHRHRATRSRAEVTADVMAGALSDSGDHSLVLSRFIDGVSEEDAALIRKALGRRGAGPGDAR